MVVEVYSCHIYSALCVQRPPHGFQNGMKVEAVDKRNPMLIRVATIVDTEDHRLKVQAVSSPSCVMTCSILSMGLICIVPLFSSRFILMAGVQSMTIGWRQTALICTL